MIHQLFFVSKLSPVQVQVQVRVQVQVQVPLWVSWFIPSSFQSLTLTGTDSTEY